MALTKLASLITRSSSRALLQRFTTKQSQCTLKMSSNPGKQNDIDLDNQPIQYSTSPAATWAAKYSQTGTNKEVPWFQPFIVSGSLASFLIYFLYLREANDIDEIFEMELGDHFPSDKREILIERLNAANVNVEKRIE